MNRLIFPLFRFSFIYLILWFGAQTKKIRKKENFIDFIRSKFRRYISGSIYLCKQRRLKKRAKEQRKGKKNIVDHSNLIGNSTVVVCFDFLVCSVSIFRQNIFIDIFNILQRCENFQHCLSVDSKIVSFVCIREWLPLYLFAIHGSLSVANRIWLSPEYRAPANWTKRNDFKSWNGIRERKRKHLN